MKQKNMLIRLSFASWIACLGVLAYQGLLWLFTGSWPYLSLADMVTRFSGFDILDVASRFPLEWGIKLTYLLATTELSLALWWMGVFLCLTHLGVMLFRR